VSCAGQRNDLFELVGFEAQTSAIVERVEESARDGEQVRSDTNSIAIANTNRLGNALAREPDAVDARQVAQ